MSELLSKYLWYDYKNYKFIEDAQIEKICGQVLYRLHVLKFINIIKENNFINETHTQGIFETVNEYLDTLNKGSFESFQPNYDPYRTRESVKNLTLYDVYANFATDPHIGKTLNHFCINQIFGAFHGHSFADQVQKAQKLAESMTWKEYDYLCNLEKTIPFHHKHSSLSHNAEDEIHLLHEIFKDTKLSFHLPSDYMEHTFFKVNLFTPIDQVLKNIETQIKKIRKERYNLPEEYKSLLNLKTNDLRSGAPKIIKSFIDHRVLPFIDIEMFSYYFNIKLTIQEKLDLLFHDDKRTLSLTKISSAEKQLKLWLNLDWVKSFGSINIE